MGPLCFLAQIEDAIQEPRQGISVMKYVDDVTIVENGMVNEESSLQATLNEFSEWSRCNNMKLNPDKCAVMNVCFMKNPLTPSPLEICSQQLKVVDCVTILGVQVSQDLKWNDHISKLIQKANTKQYTLKMLKKFNLSTANLLVIYKGYVRSLLEYPVLVWNAGLTSKLIDNLESVQKRSLRIILGSSYTSYEEVLEKCCLQSLQERRKDICTRFALNFKKSHRFRDWLPEERGEQVHYNLRNGHNVTRIMCKTKRYSNSAVPYLIGLLN